MTNPTTNELLSAYGPWFASSVAGLIYWFLRREIRKLDTKLDLLDGINAIVLTLQSNFSSFDDRMTKSEQDRLRIWEKIEKQGDVQSELKTSVAVHAKALQGLEQHPAIRGAMVAVTPMTSLAAPAAPAAAPNEPLTTHHSPS